MQSCFLLKYLKKPNLVLALGSMLLTLASGCAPVDPGEPVACPSDERNLQLHDENYVANDIHWGMWGGDYSNTHHAAGETMISTANVANLEVKWTFGTTGDVSANPTIAGDDVYFPDWGPYNLGALLSPGYVGGVLNSVDMWTGQPNWSKQVRDYNDNDFGHLSRSSPAIVGDLIIIGDIQNLYALGILNYLLVQANRLTGGWDEPCSGYVYAVNRFTGDLVWKTRVGQYDFDMISQSPVVYNGKVYVGVSTQESGYARTESYDCCQFQGNVVQLDVNSGDIDWRQYMTYNNFGATDGFSGASVWGGAPTIDPARNSIYVSTGQNFHVPAAYETCITNAAGDLIAQTLCNVGYEDNHFDSMVALDLTTGAIKWGMRSRPYDGWNGACQHLPPGGVTTLPGGPANCPATEGFDADFAQPPMLHTVLVNGQPEQRLAAGTKGGEVFSVDPDDGSIIWRRQVGPGGTLGGMEFGAATDGEQIYVQNTNFEHIPYVLEGGPDAGTTIVSGFWTALDAETGAIVWQTQVPGGELPLTGGIFSVAWGGGLGLGFFKWPAGGLTVANGVVFAGVTDMEGTMVAMDAATGAILWQFEADGQSIASSPTIVDGRLFWGTGYSKFTNSGNTVYSFGLSSDLR